MRERETERQTDRETERQRDIETERQRDRKTESNIVTAGETCQHDTVAPPGPRRLVFGKHWC